MGRHPYSWACCGGAWTGGARRWPLGGGEERVHWMERITVDSDALVGKPIVKGTRIAVEFVIELLGSGWTVEEVLEEYDQLSLKDVQACLAYASEVLKSERVFILPRG